MHDLCDQTVHNINFSHRNKEPTSVRSSSESAECLLAQRLPPILQKFSEEKANMRKHYHEIVSSILVCNFPIGAQ